MMVAELNRLSRLQTVALRSASTQSCRRLQAGQGVPRAWGFDLAEGKHDGDMGWHAEDGRRVKSATVLLNRGGQPECGYKQNGLIERTVAHHRNLSHPPALNESDSTFSRSMERLK